MVQLGVHSMVWAGGWGPQEREHAVRSSAEAGYGVIEVTAPDPSQLDAGATRELLREYGLRATCSLGLQPETDVASEDPDVVARGREVLAGALEVVRAMEGDVLCGVIHQALTRHTRPLSDLGRRHAVETMAWLCEQAGDGITVAVEVVNRYESNLLNTTEQALAFVEEVGASNLGIHLDAYHMNIEEAGLRRAIELAGDRLAYFHVGESHRGAPGTGSVPWDEVWQGLAAIGYDGKVTFESFSSAVVHPELSSALAIWRNTWDDGMALAVAARAFMAEGLTGAGLEVA